MQDVIVQKLKEALTDEQKVALDQVLESNPSVSTEGISPDSTLGDILSSLFVWTGTDQGHKYWSKICDTLEGGI